MKIDGLQKRPLENMSATHKITVPCQRILKCLKRSSHHFTQSHVWVVWGLLKDWNKRQTIFMPQCFLVMLSCCQVTLKFVDGKKIFAIKRCNLQWKWNHISQKNMRPLRAIKLYQLFWSMFNACMPGQNIFCHVQIWFNCCWNILTCPCWCWWLLAELFLIINTVKDD